MSRRERERDERESFVKTVEESDAEFWGFVERECELGDTSYDFRVGVSRVARERAREGEEAEL